MGDIKLANSLNLVIKEDSFNSLPDTNIDTEETRLKTYEAWPNKEVPPISLAKAGFSYSGNSDVVRCKFCGIEGNRWVKGDNPMEDHRNWNPNCPFVQHASGSNSPEIGTDTCGKKGIETHSAILSETLCKKLGIQKAESALHPSYVLAEARLKSFQEWPKSMKQKPSDLAEAGFFYTGFGDQTICFHCGGGLKDWEESDEPWEQHAFWFSNCNYLLMKKGTEYVTEIKSKRDLQQIEEQDPAQPSTSAVSPPASPTETKDISNSVHSNDNKESESSEKTLCKICYKNELGVVFLPCGHIVACVDCAAAVNKCPVCRKSIEASVRAFLS